MKKIFLAASIAAALTGCGSDDSSTESNPIVSNKLIDAAVEGLTYTAMPSGMSGVTGSDGSYSAKQNDTITFYLGGQNGLKVGAASNRDVLTPFEAAGKYDRAINLAILLQSLDNKFGSTGDDVLTVPVQLQSLDDATIAELIQPLNLDDRDSVLTFLNAPEINATPVSEAEALAHMETAFGSLERGGNTANPFLEAGKTIRYIDVNQTSKTNTSEYTFVHADKIFDETMFERTRGMTEMTFSVPANTSSVTELAGSQDYSISENFAEEYLSCISRNQVWIDSDDDAKKGCDTTSSGTADQTLGSVPVASEFDLISNTGQSFAYLLRDSNKTSSIDKEHNDLTDFMPFGATSVSDLNHYTPNRIWDDGDNGNEYWIQTTTSGSYDPITAIYTEIVKKDYLSHGDNETNCDTQTCSVDRTTERVAYYYEVASKTEERYVDFTGTWQQNQICDDGQTAIMTYNFDSSGLTTTGTECQNSPSTPTDIGQETNSYDVLAAMDFWWFNQANRSSQATLTELNSVVRFCDEDNYVPGNSCSAEYLIKWEYQPAGKDWDEGLLIRRKMDKLGNLDSSSIMQKVK